MALRNYWKKIPNALAFLRYHWKHISHALILLQTFGLLASLYFLHLQIKDIDNTRANRQIDLVFRFDDRFEKAPFPELRSTIEHSKPILEENGGKFNPDQLDGYLDIFETLNDVYKGHLITRDVLDSAYSYWIKRTYGNAEIQAYLKDIRGQDDAFYSGFENLAREIKAPKPTS